MFNIDIDVSHTISLEVVFVSPKVTTWQEITLVLINPAVQRNILEYLQVYCRVLSLQMVIQDYSRKWDPIWIKGFWFRQWFHRPTQWLLLVLVVHLLCQSNLIGYWDVFAPLLLLQWFYIHCFHNFVCQLIQWESDLIDISKL